jgi:hypothetical protein
MQTQSSELLKQFEAHEIDPAAFGHKEHVVIAWEMLQKYSFLDASTRYATAINTIATRAGAPEKFHMTITLAFLSLIAERAHTSSQSNIDEFLAQNPDLLSSNVLSQWYSDEQLKSELARTHFVLPNMGARS